MKRLMPYLFSVILVLTTMFVHKGLHDDENYNQRNIDKQQSVSIWSFYDSLNTHLDIPELEKVIPAAKASVVHIDCGDWQGSGFVISEYLVATARHVVEGATNFIITFDNGIVVESDLAIVMDDYDVAFIWIEDSYAEPLDLGSIKECVLGEQIFIIGSPYGYLNFNAVSTGIISGLGRDGWNEPDPYTGETYGWSIVFTSDSSASPGNSGGPLFTMDGKVRGILVGGYNSTVNCLMPVDLFINDIEGIEDMFYLEIPLDGYSINEVEEWDY